MVPSIYFSDTIPVLGSNGVPAMLLNKWASRVGQE